MSTVKKQKTIIMKEVKERKWENMHNDILFKIFSTLTLLEVSFNVSRVCNSWKAVCQDSSKSWDTLDLTKLKPMHWINVWGILKTAIHISGENLTRIIFHPLICITDIHLVSTAKRCPNVKLLVLPAGCEITPEGYGRAFGIWKELEAVVLPGYTSPLYIIQQLGENCKKLTSLKINAFFNRECASSLSCHLPWLKALSIKSAMFKRNALMMTLEGLKVLEELNISHSCLFDIPDELILEMSSRLKKLHVCKHNDCIMCAAVAGDPPNVTLVKWYRLGRCDEIKALSY